MGVACNLGGELLECSAGAAAHGGIVRIDLTHLDPTVETDPLTMS